MLKRPGTERFVRLPEVLVNAGSIGNAEPSLLADDRLTGNAFKVLVVLYQHVNHSIFRQEERLLAWPTVERIVKLTGLKTPTVKTNLRLLTQLGLIHSTKDPKGGSATREILIREDEHGGVSFAIPLGEEAYRLRDRASMARAPSVGMAIDTQQKTDEQSTNYSSSRQDCSVALRGEEKPPIVQANAWSARTGNTSAAGQLSRPIRMATTLKPDEQLRFDYLVVNAPRITSEEARALAKIDKPIIRFQLAVEQLRRQKQPVHNVGGWLRTVVTDGEFSEGATIENRSRVRAPAGKYDGLAIRVGGAGGQ